MTESKFGIKFHIQTVLTNLKDVLRECVSWFVCELTVSHFNMACFASFESWAEISRVCLSGADPLPVRLGLDGVNSVVYLR